MAKKKQKKQQGQQFLSPDKYIRQKVRTLDIGTCYISEDIENVGEGHVIVTRNHTGGRISLAFFLVDIWCVGVKDSFYRLRMEDYEVDEMIDHAGIFRECSYNEAHNWIYGAIAYAEDAGIEPDKSFALTQYFLEEDTDDIPIIEYEFGKYGQPLLVAHSHLEASRYLPLLQKNLGEGKFKYIIKDDDSEDDDFEEDDFEDEIFENSPLFKYNGPDIEYSYQHPDYPTEITLNHPWVHDELAKPENNLYLKDELIDRILALPPDTLRHDLEQLILFYIGQTCDNVPDEYDVEHYDGTLSSAVMLLAEVGTPETSLDVILEVMRQNEDFLEYHICDIAHEVLAPTLYKVGQHSLNRLLSYIKEEGLYTYAKCEAFPAVVQIALRQPERRQEVVEWFRQVLRFATESLPECKAFDSTLAGLLVCDVIDLQATELKPELEALFETGLVDCGSCGTYASVIRDLGNPRFAGHLDDCLLDIHDRFDNLHQRYD